VGRDDDRVWGSVSTRRRPASIDSAARPPTDAVGAADRIRPRERAAERWFAARTTPRTMASARHEEDHAGPADAEQQAAEPVCHTERDDVPQRRRTDSRARRRTFCRGIAEGFEDVCEPSASECRFSCVLLLTIVSRRGRKCPPFAASAMPGHAEDAQQPSPWRSSNSSAIRPLGQRLDHRSGRSGSSAADTGSASARSTGIGAAPRVCSIIRGRYGLQERQQIEYGTGRFVDASCRSRPRPRQSPSALERVRRGSACRWRCRAAQNRRARSRHDRKGTAVPSSRSSKRARVEMGIRSVRK